MEFVDLATGSVQSRPTAAGSCDAGDNNRYEMASDGSRGTPSGRHGGPVEPGPEPDAMTGGGGPGVVVSRTTREGNDMATDDPRSRSRSHVTGVTPSVFDGAGDPGGDPVPPIHHNHNDRWPRTTMIVARATRPWKLAARPPLCGGRRCPLDFRALWKSRCATIRTEVRSP